MNEQKTANSVNVRLHQILQHGYLTITRNNLFVTIFLKNINNDSPSYIKSNLHYNRQITFEELNELNLAIDLIKENDKANSNNLLFDAFKARFNDSKRIQETIQELYKFGKKISLKNAKFSEKQTNFESNLDLMKLTMKNTWNKFNLLRNGQPALPPFFKVENLLYIGSMIQRNQKAEIITTFQRLFSNACIKQHKIKEVYRQFYVKNIEDLVDPMICAVKFINTLLENLEFSQTDPLFINDSYSSDERIKIIKNEITNNFLKHNIHFVKVPLPVHTTHVVNGLYTDLNINRSPFFFEIIFCSLSTDIEFFINQCNNNINFLKVNYIFIVHPELLSEHGQNFLKEEIRSRIIAIPNLNKQRIIIITASQHFCPEYYKNKYTTELTEDDVSNLRQMGYERRLEKKYSFQIVQSELPGSGKSQYIRQKINSKNIRSYTYFIDLDNQEIPKEILYQNDGETAVHFQLSERMKGDGNQFFINLYHLFYQHGAFLSSGEPLIDQNSAKITFYFEIPNPLEENIVKDLKDKNYNSFLNLFPLPLAFPSPNDQIDENDFIKIFLKTDISYIKSQSFNSQSKYYILGINLVLKDVVNSDEQNISIENYIQTVYYTFFNEQYTKTINMRVLSYIIKYLNKYTSLFLQKLNCYIPSQSFAIFFYALTISSLYTYNITPTQKKDITFLIINNLFCDFPEENNITDKCFTFLTTRSADNFFHKRILSYNENLPFQILFQVDQDNSLKSDKYKEQLFRNFFSTNKFYQKQIDEYKVKNPNSFIAKTKLTFNSLFRFSIILTRSYLLQPSILTGNTGCGKTSSIMNIYEYLSIPYNEQLNQLNVVPGKTLNCHGGITLYDVQNHMENLACISKPLMVLFDEMNTTPSLPYIEHLFLNYKYQNNKIIFVGTLNPLVKTNKISYYLSKIGMPQIIREEIKGNTLLTPIDDHSKKPQEISQYMYHVHQVQSSTEDIMISFDPIPIGKDDDEFYPKEEQDSMHSIIRHMRIDGKEKSNLLYDLVDMSIHFIRTLMNEYAVISYRDIERLVAVYNYIYNYIFGEESKLPDDIKKLFDPSIITIITIFGLRLAHKKTLKERNFDESPNQNLYKEYIANLKKYLNQNSSGVFDKNITEEKGKITIQIRNIFFDCIQSVIKKYNKGKQETSSLWDNFIKFVIVYNWTTVQESSIWKFYSTFIHLYVLDLAVACRLPCFIIGMPGTSKSYAVELLKKKYGKKLSLCIYMSSRSSSPDGIKSQYYDAAYLEIENQDDKEFHSMVFIDEMGNANINPSRPLKFLHSILDGGIELNQEGYTQKIATAGVSNYAMDFANMNRGILVFTDLPDKEEIVKVFSYNDKLNNKELNLENLESFIKNRENINDEVKNVFDRLWNKEDEIPKTFALRSIYTISQLLLHEENIDNFKCQIARELFNAKRLNEKQIRKKEPQSYKELGKYALKLFINEDLRKNGALTNMDLFQNRLEIKKPYKSLCIFTHNFEALEFFDDITSKFNDLNFLKFFAEDFQDTPNILSYKALSHITKSILSSKNTKSERILLVDNHPVIDSILDLLNVVNIKENETRFVTLGSGFSSNFPMKNNDFFIVMIANIESLDDKENPISLPFLDRTETVYLDWEMIAPMYFNNFGINFSNEVIKEISNELEKYCKFPDDSNQIDSPFLFSNIKELYENKDKQLFKNTTLNELIHRRWSHGIKAVIRTKSKLFEDIFLPDNVTSIIKDDMEIPNFDSLREEIINNDSKCIFVLIRCSTITDLHFAHLKSFFDSLETDLFQDQNQKEKSKEFQLNCFIILYDKDDRLNPTVKWPILSMDEIYRHREFEKPLNYQELNDLKEILNTGTNFSNGTPMKSQLQHLFKQMFSYMTKQYQSSLNNNAIEVRFKNYTNAINDPAELYLVEKMNLKFDIKLSSNSQESLQSQLLENIHNVLSEKMKPFFYFSFATDKFEKSDKIYKKLLQRASEYFLKCNNLKILMGSNFENDSIIFLMDEYVNDILSNKIKSYQLEDVQKKSIVSNFFKMLINSVVQPSNYAELNNLIPDLFNNKTEKYKFLNNFIKNAEAKQTINNVIIEFIKSLLNNCISSPKLKKLFSKDINSFKSLKSYLKYLGFQSIAGLNIKQLCMMYDHTGNNQNNNFYWHNKLFQFLSDYKEPSENETISIALYNLFQYQNQCSNIEKDQNQCSNIEIDENLYNMIKKINFTDWRNIRLKKGSTFKDSHMSEDLNCEIQNLVEKPKENIEYYNSYLAFIMAPTLFYQYSDIEISKILKEKVKYFKVNDKDNSPYIYSYYTISDSGLPVGENIENSIKNLGKSINERFPDFATNLFPVGSGPSPEYISLLDDFKDLICYKSSKKFEDWLFCDLPQDNTFIIATLKRYLTTLDDTYLEHFAKVLDPFYGDKIFVLRFLERLNSDSKENTNLVNLINELSTSIILSSSADSKRKKDPFSIPVYKDNTIHIFSFSNYPPPYIPNILSFLFVTKPMKEISLIKFILKNSYFLESFSPVQKILDSILTLRISFAKIPILIPILLFNSTLFPDDNSSLPFLYDFVLLKPNFGDLKEQIKLLKQYLQNDQYNAIKLHTSYDQIAYILNIFVGKYNQIVKELWILIEQYIKSLKEKHDQIDVIKADQTIEINAITPNFFKLINSLTIKGELFSSMISEFTVDKQLSNSSGYTNINSKLFQSIIEANNNTPILEISQSGNYDFIGYSETDYKQMFFKNEYRSYKLPNLTTHFELSDSEYGISTHEQLIIYLVLLYCRDFYSVIKKIFPETDYYNLSEQRISDYKQLSKSNEYKLILSKLYNNYLPRDISTEIQEKLG